MKYIPTQTELRIQTLLQENTVLSKEVNIWASSTDQVYKQNQREATRSLTVRINENFARIANLKKSV